MPGMNSSDFWKDRSVFVTGATGFLGRWVVRSLLSAGAEVIALTRQAGSFSVPEQGVDGQRVTWVRGSIDDRDLLLRSIGQYKVDTILHIAAQSLAGTATADPIGTFKANIEGTWNILEAARLVNVRQTIIASSYQVYGSTQRQPGVETDPVGGPYPYGCSKACADLLAQTYLATWNLPVSVVRCANLFGPGDLNCSRLIPGVIQATLSDRRFVIRSDGRSIRDYLYVRDAAQAFLHLAERLAAAAPQGAYNFGLEQKSTVLEIVDRVLTIMRRKDLEPFVLNEASSEIREQYMSCEKARQLLDWAPAYSLDSGISEAINWYRDRVASQHHDSIAVEAAAGA